MEYTHWSLSLSSEQLKIRVSCTDEISGLTDFFRCRIWNRYGWLLLLFFSGLLALTLFSGRSTAESKEITVEGVGEW
jgi:hypothetical protein